VSNDPAIAPPILYPATLPKGYSQTLPTGVIPGNETGETQVPGAGGAQCDPQTDPNCFTQLQILNICQTGGGTWDYGTQSCTPPSAKVSDYTPILIASGIALIALLMVVMGGRR
jgi:hypothetical protein